MRCTIIPAFIAITLGTGATTTAAAKCAICPSTLLPGVAEIAWGLVWDREVAENAKFCGYKGAERKNPKPVYTFCMYTISNGTRIENDESLQACPKMVPLGTCV
ncbi:hypothetical protein MVEN_00173300 [Mycena venus]|uniref:Secreted protein n=1 Tax=Mycena venus TaxID=2733690 RepID=A0A8H7DEF1_9AGAR|nr:hypothetical protein MVEN_00173300 [Mycena venus]